MEMPIEYEICINCKKTVPQSNYVMHTAHCARNLKYCSICTNMVLKSAFETHQINCRPQKCQNTSVPNPDDVIKACPYCDIEFTNVNRDDRFKEHLTYCGSRTEKCHDCGEFVLFKYRQLHRDSNHGFLKLTDEPGPRATWETPSSSNGMTSRKKKPMTPDGVDSPPESYQEISRRIDSKTEYIRSVLQDSARITAPLRNRATPSSSRSHNKGPAPPPPSAVIDLTDNPSSPDDVNLPCEFCPNMYPASQLLRHQMSHTID